MAKAIRKPPSVSEMKDPRGQEYFANALYDTLRLVGTRTFDVPSIAAGAKETFNITVPDCRADQGQTVQLGLPSTFNANLVPWGYVSANNTVTVVIYNPTAGAIDPASASYSCRVMP